MTSPTVSSSFCGLHSARMLVSYSVIAREFTFAHRLEGDSKAKTKTLVTCDGRHASCTSVTHVRTLMLITPNRTDRPTESDNEKCSADIHLGGSMQSELTDQNSSLFRTIRCFVFLNFLLGAQQLSRFKNSIQRQ